MREVTKLAQEANCLLSECRETVDEYVTFAKFCSSEEQLEAGEEWAAKAIENVIGNIGKTNMSLAGVAALLERIHEAGLILLEHNFNAMVQEKFAESMA